MGDEIDIYARVSRLVDDRQRSVQGQVEDCTVRVLDLGREIGQVHIDSGRSAWNPKVKRPGWDRLMRRLEAGETGGVIVFDLARFSRRPIEGERLIAAAERGMLVLDSEDSYDLTTASGKKAFRDQLSAAAYESDRLSTRSSRGKRIKAMRGEPNCSRRTFGFEAGNMTPHPTEAPALRDVAERILHGETISSVVDDLNQRGILTATGHQWTIWMLGRVLTRPRNAGLVDHRGKIVGRLAGEPILTQETWERLCALMASRRRGRPNSDTYVASGVAHCGACGRTVTGRVYSGLVDSAGLPVRAYYCRWCPGTSIDQRQTDAALRELVAAALSDPRHAAAVEEAAAERASRAQELDAQIAEADHTAEELAGRLGRGEMSLARYDAAVAPLDRRLAELRMARAALDDAAELPPDPALATAAYEQWLAQWDAATTEERRSLLRQALRGKTLSIVPVPRNTARLFEVTDRLEFS